MNGPIAINTHFFYFPLYLQHYGLLSPPYWQPDNFLQAPSPIYLRNPKMREDLEEEIHPQQVLCSFPGICIYRDVIELQSLRSRRLDLSER